MLSIQFGGAGCGKTCLVLLFTCLPYFAKTCMRCCAGPSDSTTALLDASAAFFGSQPGEQDPDAWLHGDQPALGITDYFEHDQDMM